MLITTTLIQAKYDKRTTKRQKETAKTTAQLTWKVTGLHVSPLYLEQVSPTLYTSRASLIFNWNPEAEVSRVVIP